MNIEERKKNIALKRLELAVDEAELRIYDLENEVEKQKAKTQILKENLENMRNKKWMNGLINPVMYLIT